MRAKLDSKAKKVKINFYRSFKEDLIGFKIPLVYSTLLHFAHFALASPRIKFISRCLKKKIFLVHKGPSNIIISGVLIFIHKVKRMHRKI